MVEQCRTTSIHLFQPLLVALFLINFVGKTSARCSTTEFDNCVNNLPVEYPCKLSEFDSYCSNYTRSRQCLNRINCTDGDVGYTQVNNFGSFSNYVMKSNEIDSNLMLCNYKTDLSNQIQCVLRDNRYNYITFSTVNLLPIDFNAVSLFGDHCGFLDAYYRNIDKLFRRDFYGQKNIAQIVVNATLKRYELHQQKCANYDGRLPYNESTLEECISLLTDKLTSLLTNRFTTPAPCSPYQLDILCSTFDTFTKCLPSLNVSTWTLGYLGLSPCRKYYPVVRAYSIDHVESYQYLCSYKSVINSSCTLEQAAADFAFLDFTNYSSCDELCRHLNSSIDQLHTALHRKNASEEIITIIMNYYMMQIRFFGCDMDVLPPTTAVNSHSPGVATVLPLTVNLLSASISMLFFMFGY